MFMPSVKLTILSTIAFASLAFGGESSDDKKSIEGTWSVTYAFIDGKQVKADELKQGEVVISAGKLAFRKKGTADKNARNVWQFQMDPSKKPKTIDVQLEIHKLRPDGSAIEVGFVKMLGIYELKGNELRIAFSNGVPLEKNEKDQKEADKAVTRPTSFEHGPDVAGAFVLKRAGK